MCPLYAVITCVILWGGGGGGGGGGGCYKMHGDNCKLSRDFAHFFLG